MPWNNFSDVRAAKEHPCAWCKTTPIKKGEIHRKYVGEHEGDFQSWRVHEEDYPIMIDTMEVDGGFICPNVHQKGRACEDCQMLIDERFEENARRASHDPR